MSEEKETKSTDITMNVYQILNEIQCNLNVPKGRDVSYNGKKKYSYRSLEDILENLKPYLEAFKSIILLSDEIVEKNNQLYIKATATLVGPSGDKISVDGWARENMDKGGMDTSQMTGSASSYARKYALNGLFALDDNKDPDDIDPSTHYATQEQINNIKMLVKDIKALMVYYKINSLEQLTRVQAQDIINKKSRNN